MTVFFTADTHFGHSDIVGCCKRPFASVEEMVTRWNAVVSPIDEVWHVGDFANGRDPARYFDRLSSLRWSVRRMVAERLDPAPPERDPPQP